MDATKEAEDRIMGPILRRLLPAADALAKEISRAHALGTAVPGLSRKLTVLIGVMRWAARQAAARTEGLNQADVQGNLTWRTERAKAVAKIIRLEDNPSLGTMLSLPHQARALASDLTAKVSDTLVTQLTEQRQSACGPGDVLIWQPERNACVRCLKYAGRFRAAKETFQGGLSFDPAAPKPDPKDRIAGPPLHPNCRCELDVIPQSSAAANATALKREAERSVLKGWALNSESDAVRTRAAQQLLDSHVTAPKTVIAETRKRLKSGEPFIRDVP
jgi:hypothetical protein